MRKYDLKMVGGTVPECEEYKKSMNYTYWDCQFRYDTRPENHQAGTCKMGTSADRMAVVNPSLKVYGIEGLRVADASVMPRVSSRNFDKHTATNQYHIPFLISSCLETNTI